MPGRSERQGHKKQLYADYAFDFGCDCLRWPRRSWPCLPERNCAVPVLDSRPLSCPGPRHRASTIGVVPFRHSLHNRYLSAARWFRLRYPPTLAQLSIGPTHPCSRKILQTAL